MMSRKSYYYYYYYYQHWMVVLALVILHHDHAVVVVTGVSIVPDAEYLTNESEDAILSYNSEQRPTRVIIPEFQLTLQPTFGALTRREKNIVRNAANTVLEMMFPTEVPQGVSVDYIKLVTVSRRRQQQQEKQQRRQQQALRRTITNVANATTATNTTNTNILNTNRTRTVLKIDGGVASFNRGEVPSVNQVNAWVKEALEQPLLEYIREETHLNYIQSIQFQSSVPISPTPSPAAVFMNQQQMEPITISNTNTGMTVGVISSMMALTAIMVFISLLNLRRKRATVAERMFPYDDDDDEARDNNVNDEHSHSDDDENGVIASVWRKLERSGLVLSSSSSSSDTNHHHDHNDSSSCSASSESVASEWTNDTSATNAPFVAEAHCSLMGPMGEIFDLGFHTEVKLPNILKHKTIIYGQQRKK